MTKEERAFCANAADRIADHLYDAANAMANSVAPPPQAAVQAIDAAKRCLDSLVVRGLKLSP